jgi:hypothetical protein
MDVRLAQRVFAGLPVRRAPAIRTAFRGAVLFPRSALARDVCRWPAPSAKPTVPYGRPYGPCAGFQFQLRRRGLLDARAPAVALS